MGATKQQAWEKLCLSLCREQKHTNFGAFQCLEHSTSSLLKTGWFYFPLFFAGVRFRNGQSQFSTSDSICTSEQEGNSFWEPPRNLLFPQQVHGNWWLFCILRCHHRVQSFSLRCFVMLTHTLAGKVILTQSLCVSYKTCPHMFSMCREHLQDHLFHLFGWRLYPLCIYYWFHLAGSILNIPCGLYFTTSLGTLVDVTRLNLDIFCLAKYLCEEVFLVFSLFVLYFYYQIRRHYIFDSFYPSYKITNLSRSHVHTVDKEIQSL